MSHSFTSTVPRRDITYRIENDLIAIGATTWQTKNLTAVSIDQARVKMLVPEPQFKADKPTQKVRWGVASMALAFAWTFATTTEYPPKIGLFLTAIISFGVWFVSHYAHTNNLRIWAKRRNEVKAQQQIWSRLASQTPTVYSLILESSSGRSVALSTFGHEALGEIHQAMLVAMRGSSTPAAAGSINTLDPLGHPVETLYEKYCHSEIDDT